MNVTFTGGTAVQRQWFDDAVHGSPYPFHELADVNLDVEWGDPAAIDPTGNHSDFACTRQNADGSFVMIIRSDLDKPGRDTQYGHLYEGKDFYQETVLHELGHVVQFHLSNASPDHDAFCAIFGAASGQWNPVGAPWQNRVQEAVAETFKDLAFSGRKFDNRTLYRLPAAQLNAFVAKLGGGAVVQTFGGW